MAKKIYDIYPPHIKKEKESMISSQKNKKNKKNSLSFFSFKKISIFTIVVLLIFVLASHTVFLKAKIVIWPKTTEASYLGEITVDSSVYSLNLENGVIPAEIFEIREKESRTFNSSGKETEGKKAEGILKVYNNYSFSPQSLVENTRFISADGKLFHSTKRITIPGKKSEGGRVVPGEVEVLVKAAEAGEEYNIERTSKFSVPGLQGTALYTEIYAENIEPITGGHLGELPLITEEDIENAREVLISDLSNKAKSKIKEESAGGFIIENELIRKNVLEESFYPGVGDNSDSFEYSMDISLEVISFKKSDLEESARNFLFKKESSENNDIFSGKEIFSEELMVIFHPELINFREGRAILGIDLTVPVYSEIDKNNFKNNLSGKRIEEVKTVMEEYPQIEDFELSYWPFWINTLPKFNKIEVEIKMKK